VYAYQARRMIEPNISNSLGLPVRHLVHRGYCAERAEGLGLLANYPTEKGATNG